VGVVVSLSQGRTAAAQCGSFTHKSVPVIFEPPCVSALQENSVLEGSNRQKVSTLISVTYIHNFTPYNCKTSMFMCVCLCV